MKATDDKNIQEYIGGVWRSVSIIDIPQDDFLELLEQLRGGSVVDRGYMMRSCRTYRWCVSGYEMWADWMDKGLNDQKPAP